MEEITLNLSSTNLMKIPKFSQEHQQKVTNLIVDNNELQRVEGLDSFGRLQKLSIAGNQLVRMYNVCRLYSLQYLNLSNNCIIAIEGIKELISLKWLCLAGNKIKTIEHLHTNTILEYLDLANNNISFVGDLASLRNLKELHLRNNKISHLRHCDRYLPTSLLTLTLAGNCINDLNEISQLVHLVNLTAVSIANNPCVLPPSNSTNKTAIGFDYYPFVKNWCLNVKLVDGLPVEDLQSLKAEWLYSQGKGRAFRLGDQHELIQYLESVCPLNSQAPETEEDKKLRIILSKAQHHQQQLREQSTKNVDSEISSPNIRKRVHAHNSAVVQRVLSERSCATPNSSDSNLATQMSRSCHETFTTNSTPERSLMSRSLDSSHFLEKSPLQTLSKMLPVPENLMSPDCGTPPTQMPIIKSNWKPAVPKSPKPKPQPKSNITTATALKNTPTTKTAKSAVNTTILRNSQRSSPLPIKRYQQQEQQSSPSISPKSGSLRSTLRENSPRTGTVVHLQRSTTTTTTTTSEDDSSETPNLSKLATIQQRAKEKQQQNSSFVGTVMPPPSVEQAAICIQKHWRGYTTRNNDRNVQFVYRTLQAQRAHDHIQQLTDDMRTTKAALENERKIQMLQTEAISALWKQVLTLQQAPSGGGGASVLHSTDALLLHQPLAATTAMDNVTAVKHLAITCNVLQNQIEQLQTSVQDIVKVMSQFSEASNNHHQQQLVGATQTEIIAVRTPYDDEEGVASAKFPFLHGKLLAAPTATPLTSRPSTLPLLSNPTPPSTEPDILTAENLDELVAEVTTDLRKLADTMIVDVDNPILRIQSSSE